MKRLFIICYAVAMIVFPALVSLFICIHKSFILDTAQLLIIAILNICGTGGGILVLYANRQTEKPDLSENLSIGYYGDEFVLFDDEDNTMTNLPERN